MYLITLIWVITDSLAKQSHHLSSNPVLWVDLMTSRSDSSSVWTNRPTNYSNTIGNSRQFSIFKIVMRQPIKGTHLNGTWIAMTTSTKFQSYFNKRIPDSFKTTKCSIIQDLFRRQYVKSRWTGCDQCCQSWDNSLLFLSPLILFPIPSSSLFLRFPPQRSSPSIQPGDLAEHCKCQISTFILSQMVLSI